VRRERVSSSRFICMPEINSAVLSTHFRIAAMGSIVGLFTMFHELLILEGAMTFWQRLAIMESGSGISDFKMRILMYLSTIHWILRIK